MPKKRSGKRGSTGKGQTPKQSKGKRKEVSEELYNNEQDDFLDARDRVMMDAFSDDEVSDASETQEVLALSEDEDDMSQFWKGKPTTYNPEEDEDLKNISKHWGSDKRDFYQVDEADDAEAEEAEEEEALRLQREQAARYSAGDFGEISDDEDEEEDEEEEASKEQLEFASKQMMSMDLDGEEEVEKIERDISHLSEAEKMKILKNESPELVQLLKEFTSRLAEVKEGVLPLLKQLKEDKVPTSSGMAILSVKNQLLLSYCIDICFYLLLKAEGKKVEDHPVMTQLVRLRIMMDKIQPVERKLRYQIEKLLRLASGEAGGEAERNEGADDEDVDEMDPLRFKPNPKSFLSGDADSSEDEEEEVDFEEYQKSEGIYQAPKHMPVHFDERDDDEAKLEKKKLKARQKASKSAMMDVIREVYTDAPEELSSIGTGTVRRRTRDEEMEQQELEERNFTRLAETKKERQKKNQEMFRTRLADDLEDYREVARAEVFAKGGGADPLRKSQAEGTFMNALKKSQSKKRKAEALDEEDDDLEEDPYYMQAMHDMKRRKVEKVEKAERRKSKKAAKKSQEYMEDVIEEGDKRDISYEIKSNRGLTPHRKKEARNPRKQMRGKFDKAAKKRSGAVRKIRTEKTPYAGEETGINQNVVRSIRLK